MEMTLGGWRISVERAARTDAEFAGMYNRAAGRWHDKIRFLGYARAYDELFVRLEGDG